MSTAAPERVPTLFDAAFEAAASLEAAVDQAPAPFEAAVDQPLAPVDAAVERSPSYFDAVGDEPTLDEVLSGVWEGLIAHRVEECPVCGGELVPDDPQSGWPIGGRCGDCGTTLS